VSLVAGNYALHWRRAHNPAFAIFRFLQISADFTDEALCAESLVIIVPYARYGATRSQRQRNV
jgi:hypothetical protein